MSSQKKLITVAAEEPFEVLRDARAGFAEAKKRVGNDHRQHLKWLLEFLYLDLSQLSPGEQWQLKFDIAFFSGKSNPFDLPPLTSIARLANEVRRGVEQLLSQTRWVIPLPRASRLELTIAPRAVERAGRINLDGWESTYSSDDFPTAFLLSAADSLAAEGTRIGRCAQKECRRLFARHRRARYCSLACSQKERDSRFRQRHTKQELSRLRHQYYKNKVARERNPSVANKVRARGAKPKSS